MIGCIFAALWPAGSAFEVAASELADNLPRAKLVIIPDVGHVPHEEQPAAFLQAVDGFVMEVSR